MKDYGQIISVVGTLKTVLQAMKQQRLTDDVLSDIKAASEEINQQLYHVSKLKFQRIYDMEQNGAYEHYVTELGILISTWEMSIQCRTDNVIDEQFWEIYEFFKYVDKEVIYEKAVEHFKDLSEALRIELLSLPYRYENLKGKLDFVKNDFSLIKAVTDVMVNNIENYRYLYERLADDKSREILNFVIRYWFEICTKEFEVLMQDRFPLYYSMDILLGKRADTIVDFGVEDAKLFLDKYDVVRVNMNLNEFCIDETIQRKIWENKAVIFMPAFDMVEDIFKMPLFLWENNSGFKIYMRVKKDEIWPVVYFIAKL